MSHDLMRELVEALGAKVVRVLVTELRDGTFFAELHLRSGERDLVVSCRPSDGIALATRTRSPLYVCR
jgi:bifunctional DNase/RNase